ncbi:hypothetical protein BB561_003997 [Smittium simulii]|uniref:BRO1 domain-containing protein n=1 Tax=Smittium simulii TaxID=133385 RepID=A0A2T9YIK9_9FUNG|nr:hypothetical protein BB561_003997 [Smittium simulii]
MDLIAIPLKQTLPSEFKKTLNMYIGQTYAEPPEAYAEDIRILEGMREDATLNFGLFTESCISFIDRTIRYYGQLCLLFTKFPPNATLDFSWFNTFDSQIKLTYSDLWFERASILFNIGAIYSQAATQTIDQNINSYVNAFKYLQKAAGAFQLMRTTVVPECRYELSYDMNSTTLTFLENLMLAQAQECTFSKCIASNMKNANIAKVAAAVVNLYENCLTSTKIPSWKDHISFKIKYFEAVAQYRQANECLEAGKHGEEIARLELANDFLSHLKKMIDNDSSLSKKISSQFFNSYNVLTEIVTENLNRSKYDNDIIYLNLIPSISDLSPIQPFIVAKSEIPDILQRPELYVDKEELGSALFKSLVPLVVHQAVSLYEDRKDQYVRMDILSPLDELSVECEKTLISLNIAESLEAIDKPIGIPPQIILGADQIKSEGGFLELQKMCSQLVTSYKRAISILKNAEEALQTEAIEDQNLRSSYQSQLDQIDRLKSIDMNSNYRNTIIQYHSALDKASANDATIFKKLENWKNFIKLLESGRDQIMLALPSLSNSDEFSDPNHKTILSRLKEYYKEIQYMQKERRDIISDLNKQVANDDISSELVQHVDHLFLKAKTPFIKIELEIFEPLFEDRLTNYNEYKNILEEQKIKQHELLQNLKETNLAFIATRKSHPLFSKRESALANLQKAIERFHEISSGLNEGSEFYANLILKLEELKNNCVDFCMARNIEALEFLSK